MPTPSSNTQFTQDALDKIFPPDRADRFFEALFGDAEEGAYDISLVYRGEANDQIDFAFHLKQRAGKCLACNLTYGLPDVFMRHRVIDVADVVRQIDSMMTNGKRCKDWKIGRTREVSRALHLIPLSVKLVPVKSAEST
jgi:hypothetical protein